MLNRKKAFTLTELLVVVIVLGVLSAVAVPKFSRVLETRRTAEAESMLSAIRMEQEKRCALGKQYTGNFANIPSVAYAKVSNARAASPNYTYVLTQTGVEAAREEKDYILKIPSYKEGAVCCEGAGCASLNKSYPACLPPQQDECAADVCEVSPTSCACPAYAQSHRCECSPSAANCCQRGEVYINGQCMTECEAYKDTAHCCTDTQIRQGMEYNIFGKLGSPACACPAGTELVNGMYRGEQHCCPAGNVWKDGQCMTLCEARPSTENCCSGGREWNGSACECPEGSVWNGTSCEDSCEDVYGLWQPATSWGTGECNNDFEKIFSCADKRSAVNYSCTDYMTQYETVPAQAWSRYQTGVGGGTVIGQGTGMETSFKTLSAFWTDPFVSFAGPELWTAQLCQDSMCKVSDLTCCHNGIMMKFLNLEKCMRTCNGSSSGGSTELGPVECNKDEVCSDWIGIKCYGCCKKSLYVNGVCCRGSNQHISNGHCCPKGEEWDGNKCAVPCQEPFEKDSSGNCVCPSGYPYEYNGKCYKCPGAEYEFMNGQCRKAVYKKRSVSCCANIQKKPALDGTVSGSRSFASGL